MAVSTPRGAGGDQTRADLVLFVLDGQTTAEVLRGRAAVQPRSAELIGDLAGS